MKVLLLSTSNSRNAGGLYNSVRSLGQALIKYPGIKPAVLAFEDERSSTDVGAYKPLELIDYHIIGPAGFGFSIDLRSKIKQFQPTIVHSQGVWLYSSYINMKYSRQTRTPYIISPRGMLDPWILNSRNWKKKIGLALYEKEHLKYARCLHALGMPEHKALRDFGCKNPIAVIPNGVFLPEDLELSNIQLPEWKRKDNRKVLLFLSRLHPKKGLENLMMAWQKANFSKKNWRLIIAGESKGEEYLKSLFELRTKLRIEDDVFFIGPQFHQDKDICFRCADAFILPSFSEGMPMAVLEAWSYGLPAIITKECNLPEGFEKNAAIQIEADPDNIASILNTLFEMQAVELKKIGGNGLELVKEKFTWSSIAAQMTHVYDYILTGSNPPSTVLFD